LTHGVRPLFLFPIRCLQRPSVPSSGSGTNVPPLSCLVEIILTSWWVGGWFFWVVVLPPTVLYKRSGRLSTCLQIDRKGKKQVCSLSGQIASDSSPFRPFRPMHLVFGRAFPPNAVSPIRNIIIFRFFEFHDGLSFPCSLRGSERMTSLWTLRERTRI